MPCISAFRILALLIATSFLFNSCEKLVDDIADTSISAEDAAAAEGAIGSAFDIIDDIASTDARLQKTGTSLLPIGASLVFTDSLFTDGNGVAFYVDFGPYNPNAPVNGIKCPDGKFRAGRIEISVSKPFTEMGCIITAQFPTSDSYYIGNGTSMAQVIGSLEAVRIGAEKVSLEVKDAEIITKSGTVKLSASHEIKRTIGTGNVGTLDDEFEITGTGSGTNHKGDAFTVLITKTLVKRVANGCANTFIIGEVEIKNVDASSPLILDFDPDNDGACDGKALLTLPGGIQKTITVE